MRRKATKLLAPALLSIALLLPLGMAAGEETSTLGDLFNEFSTDSTDALRDSFELRDSEQFLVKLSYRFEL